MTRHASPHRSRAVWMLVLLAAACGKTQQRAPAQPAVTAAVAAVAAEQASVAPPAPALPAVVPLTPEERARGRERLRPLFERLAKSAPPPRVLFEVEAAECCEDGASRGCREDCAQAHALFYDALEADAWGPGSLFVDAKHQLWIHDRVMNRHVAFDRTGKVQHIVPTLDRYYEGTSLAYVTADEVRVLVPDNAPHRLGIARYGFDGKYRGGAELASVLSTDAARSLWSLPGETARFFAITPVRSYDVVDLVLDGPTIAFTAKRPLTRHGHRYAFSCDQTGSQPEGTLVIDEHRIALAGCPPLRYVAADGSVIVGDARFDATGQLTGALFGPPHELELGLGDRGEVVIGPDGRAYSYVTKKRSVQLVELSFATP
jgi:hypothetical protein